MVCGGITRKATDIMRKSGGPSPVVFLRSMNKLNELRQSLDQEYPKIVAQVVKKIGRKIYQTTYDEFLTLFPDGVIVRVGEDGHIAQTIRADLFYMGVVAAAVVRGHDVPGHVIDSLPQTREGMAIRHIYSDLQNDNKNLSTYIGEIQKIQNIMRRHGAPSQVFSEQVDQANQSVERLITLVRYYLYHRSPDVKKKVNQFGVEVQELTFAEFNKLCPDGKVYRTDSAGQVEAMSDAEWVYLSEVAAAALSGKKIPERVIASLPNSPESAALKQLYGQAE